MHKSYLLQAFDRVLPFPFPDHIHCNEGSKCYGSPFSSTFTRPYKKSRSAKDTCFTPDLPAFLAQHA